MNNKGLSLATPRITPELDPSFCPAVLANRKFFADALATQKSISIKLALEQADGSVFHYDSEIFPAGHPCAGGNFRYVERLVKFLLWSRGGFRVYVGGADTIARELQQHFQETATGRFDANIMGERIYERPFRIVATTIKEVPPARASTTPLGRHLDGCRIGFDLGGSDRKVAAVIDGQVVFSEETVWDPYISPTRNIISLVLWIR